MTYTYVLMDVSESTYQEIKQKLEAAGYDHALHASDDSREVVLDMHGIALRLDSKPKVFDCCDGTEAVGHSRGCIYGKPENLV